MENHQKNFVDIIVFFFLFNGCVGECYEINISNVYALKL